jgi:hypothetical protein
MYAAKQLLSLMLFVLLVPSRSSPLSTWLRSNWDGRADLSLSDRKAAFELWAHDNGNITLLFDILVEHDQQGRPVRRSAPLSNLSSSYSPLCKSSLSSNRMYAITLLQQQWVTERTYRSSEMICGSTVHLCPPANKRSVSYLQPSTKLETRLVSELWSCTTTSPSSASSPPPLYAARLLQTA